MDTHEFTTEARRWAKFPATVLFVTGFIWLLDRYFHFNTAQVGEQTETGIGALGALIDLVVVPLGSVVVALALLFVQRWSYFFGAVLPLYPLVVTSIRLAGKVQTKFSEYRNQGLTGSFGDGVMTALLVIALWVIFALMVAYIWKSWKLLNSGQEWLKRPGPADPVGQDSGSPPPQESADPTDSEFDPLFPIVNADLDTND